MDTSPATVEKFDFIINRRAGAVLKAGEGKARADILSQFGDRAGTFTYVEGGDVAAAVKDWAEKNGGKDRGLVIGGGDGTVVTAAEQVLGREDITLGILPMGTQNFVARQLGFSPDFRKAAAQYKEGQGVEMDVGKVNGMLFLVAIALDRNSVNFFEAREDLRNKKYLSALRKSFAATVGFLAGKKNDFSVSTEKDGQSGEKISSRFVTITNNRLSPRPVMSIPYNASSLKNIITRVMGKGKESTGELSLYAFKGGLIRTAGIMPAILRGRWNRRKSVKSESATQFFIKSGGAAEKSFILDGEIKKTQYPLEVSIIPKGLRMFKPS